MDEEVFFIPRTVINSREWEELTGKENRMGPDNLLSEIIDKKIWSNAEIVWVLRRMIYYYGRKDELLKKIPIDRLFTNMVDILRVFYLLVDNEDPDLDENMRSYISSKMVDATWGINTRTRDYLFKL